MTPYSENLNNTILSCLQSQEMDEKTLRSQLDASSFSLYYTQGATISAKQKLKATESKAGSSSIIKSQATNAANIAANLVASSNLATGSTKQAITDSAVNASNVQIASNAIMRLASNIGSIYSIVNTSDLGSDMNTEAAEIMNLINNTASAAELLSQLAMETSSMSAEISASQLSDEAKKTADALNNLTKIVSDDFDKINQSIISDGIISDTASTAEQKANGAVQDALVAHTSAQNAYTLNNKMLNLNLSVFKITDDSYEVIFDEIVKPFDKSIIVKDYYIILLKENKKLLFSLSAAENIYSAHPGLLVPTGEVKTGEIKTIINFKDPKLLDADGEPIQFGTKYAAAVFAIYIDAYKKQISNFNDFLSAPSPAFCLTHQLEPVNSVTIKVVDIKHGYELTFKTMYQENHKCVYRCMFLPTANQHQADNTTGINFSFDIMLAEQVAPGNYTLALEVEKDIIHVPIEVNTTDIFGNLLCDGTEYIPVILSTPKVSAIDQDKYKSAISDFNTTPSFIYKRNILTK